MKKTGPDETTRRLVLRRDGYKCVICGLDLEKCITGYSIHHRRMRSHPWPGLNWPTNLICLCGSGTTGCHGKVHAYPDKAYENGWLVHAWEDEPATVPIQTSHGTMYLTEDGLKWDIFHSLLKDKGKDGHGKGK